MNSRAQPPRTAGVCGVGFRLLFGLLPCIVVGTPPLSADPRWPIRSRPYLAVLGSAPLRIQEAAPPPDLSVRPPAGAPPVPVTAVAEAPPELLPSPVEPSAQASEPSQPLPPSTESPPAAAPEAKPIKPAKSILPDDTRPKVRAEDFLPFFQPPGANPNPNDVTLAPTPPAPGVQPPSSATYKQQ